MSAPITVALQRGHTMTGVFTGGEYDLCLAHREDADLDDAFDATCLETGEILRVNGWLFVRQDQP